MRKISDDDLRKLVMGKKIDFRGTRLLRQEENRKATKSADEVETEQDHPLIAQGKAVTEIVAVLGRNLITQNKVLADIVNDEVEMIRSMQATTPVRALKLTVNRNAEGFIESINVIPADDEEE